MRNHMPPYGQFDVFLEKAKVAFRKNRQRKNERALQKEKPLKEQQQMNAQIFAVKSC